MNDNYLCHSQYRCHYYYHHPFLPHSHSHSIITHYTTTVLGLLPYVRQLRNMSREQLFICAMETREKQLLAQELYKRNGRCDAVRYEEGAIIIENETGNGIDNGNYSGIDENGNMKDLIAIQGNFSLTLTLNLPTFHSHF